VGAHEVLEEHLRGGVNWGGQVRGAGWGRMGVLNSQNQLGVGLKKPNRNPNQGPKRPPPAWALNPQTPNPVNP
jgi:hypothetical protein